MDLIIGGAYQGKTDYAKEKFALTDGEIAVCGTQTPDMAARCLCHLERFALACVKAGKEPAQVLKNYDLRDKILICDDISCGVVPIDPEMREWREAVGRMTAALAAKAGTVTRVFCGLPLVLKG